MGRSEVSICVLGLTTILMLEFDDATTASDSDDNNSQPIGPNGKRKKKSLTSIYGIPPTSQYGVSASNTRPPETTSGWHNQIPSQTDIIRHHAWSTVVPFRQARFLSIMLGVCI